MEGALDGGESQTIVRAVIVLVLLLILLVAVRSFVALGQKNENLTYTTSGKAL